MIKIAPYKLLIPRGGDFMFKPRCTAVPGTDMTLWTAEWVVKDKYGSEIFRKTSPMVIVTPGTLNIAEPTFSLTEVETATLANDPVAGNYHVALIDAATDWTGIVLHGTIEAYVTSGGS